MLRPRALLALQVVTAGAVAVVACSSGHVKPAPPPVLTTEASTTSTTATDLLAVPLPTVAGQPRVTIAVGPGRATINGTVSGPTGPVAGATVLAERVVDNAVADVTVTTNPDGTFSIPNILGGLFRLRAWLAPTLADTQAAILFLGGTETKSVNLDLAQYGNTQVAATIAPDPPILGWPAELAVAVTSATVGNDGVVRASPVPGVSLQLVADGQWSTTGSDTAVTGSDGAVRWHLTCQALGPQGLSVVVNGGNVVPLTIAPCAPVPTTTTAPTSTTVAGQTTTTTRRRGTTTTSG